jgi:hypothetical protein
VIRRLTSKQCENFLSKEVRVGDLLVFDTISEHRSADVSLVIFVSKQKVIYFNLECEGQVFEHVFDKPSTARNDLWYNSIAPLKEYVAFTPLFKTCDTIKWVISP